MKNPRELLLSRHQSASPRLDSIRRAAVAGVGEERAAYAPGFLTPLWRELFWSCRRVWAGLAVAWAVILVLDVSSSNPVETIETAVHLPSPQLANQLEGQRRLLAELLEMPGRETIVPQRSTPRPHSARNLPVALA